MLGNVRHEPSRDGGPGAETPRCLARGKTRTSAPGNRPSPTVSLAWSPGLPFIALLRRCRRPDLFLREDNIWASVAFQLQAQKSVRARPARLWLPRDQLHPLTNDPQTGTGPSVERPGPWNTTPGALVNNILLRPSPKISTCEKEINVLRTKDPVPALQGARRCPSLPPQACVP